MARRGAVPLGILLTALVALGPISTDMYLPALPALAVEFAASPARIQLTLSLFLIAFAFSQLVYGPLSDRFGRRWVLFGGIVVYAVASVGCALAESAGELITARFAQGIGACAGPVLARAVVRDLYGREKAARMLAYMGMAMGLIPAAAPILGGYVTVALGWRANFVLLTGFGGLLILGVLFILHETNTARDPTATGPAGLLRNYGALVRSRAYIGYVLAVACGYGALFAFIQGSAFVLIDFLGVATEDFGLYFAINVVGYILGSLIAGRYSSRVGLDAMVLLGTAIMAAGGALMAGLAWSGLIGVAEIIGPQLVFMVGLGVVMPNAIAGAIAPFPKMAGAASALLGFTQMSVAGLSGMATGLFEDGTQLPMATALFALSVASFLFYWRLTWPLRDRIVIEAGSA